MSYDKQIFGDNIKVVREALLQTQIEFADALGISKSTINKLERGLGNPTLETVAKLLNISKQSLDFFLVVNTDSTLDSSLKEYYNWADTKALEDRLKNIEKEVALLKAWKGDPL
jgi:transcriptional regulator with XRE-family HTH domain